MRKGLSLEEDLPETNMTFWLRSAGWDVGTWPHIATRELRNGVFFLDCPVPGKNLLHKKGEDEC